VPDTPRLGRQVRRLGPFAHSKITAPWKIPAGAAKNITWVESLIEAPYADRAAIEPVDGDPNGEGFLGRVIEFDAALERGGGLSGFVVGGHGGSLFFIFIG
jgi:hypothetical protein